MNTQIAEWADTYVPQLNALSEKYEASYYTQSPLIKVEDDVEEMIIGINPGGPLSNGKTIMSTEEFLRGNPKWGERFVVPYKCVFTCIKRRSTCGNCRRCFVVKVDQIGLEPMTSRL